MNTIFFNVAKSLFNLHLTVCETIHDIYVKQNNLLNIIFWPVQY